MLLEQESNRTPWSSLPDMASLLGHGQTNGSENVADSTGFDSVIFDQMIPRCDFWQEPGYGRMPAGDCSMTVPCYASGLFKRGCLTSYWIRDRGAMCNSASLNWLHLIGKQLEYWLTCPSDRGWIGTPWERRGRERPLAEAVRNWSSRCRQKPSASGLARRLLSAEVPFSCTVASAGYIPPHNWALRSARNHLVALNTVIEAPSFGQRALGES